MTEIQLENLSFFGHHGITEEERKTGNKYRVDILLQLNEQLISFNSIEDTVDYASVYKIAEEEMAKPTALLEQIAVRLLDRIAVFKSKVIKAEVSVAKFNPPIGGVCEKSTVRMIRSYQDH